MSIHGHGAYASKERLAGTLASATMTLADILFRLEADDGLDRRWACEMRSAIKTVCRVLGAEPGLSTSASPEAGKANAGDRWCVARPLEQYQKPHA
jgi:hypothetical protein